VLIAALAIAGCGGSKHATSTTSTPTTASPPTTSSTASTPATTTTSSTSTTTAPAKRKAKTKAAGSGGVSAQPSSPKSGSGSSPGTSVKNPAGGSGSARVPATFTIRASGVSPTTVSAPAFLAVQVTAISADGQPHTVVVKVPGKQRTLSVPAHGRASVLIPGLKAGDYPVEIDGKPRAKLTIGGEPGP
jgi:hypothetical protein